VTADLALRRPELGAAAADKPPAWAVRYLGMPPREPGALRDDWISRAGLVASYREAAGHTDPEQAVGLAPVGRPVLREAYLASVAALEMQEEERARELPQRELEARVRAYGRAVAWAPQQVGDDLEATKQAERDALAQAEEARARDMAEISRSALALADQLAERRASLAEISDARDAWEEQTSGAQERARQAVAELDRRGVQHEDPEPQPEPVAETEAPSEPEQPQPDLRAAELDQHVQQAREAVVRIAAEREQARQAEAEQIDLEQSTSRAQAEVEASEAQAWQAGEAAVETPEAEAELELEM
jgi:hypothetical protein